VIRVKIVGRDIVKKITLDMRCSDPVSAPHE
jgi:hypothetical protein